MFSRDISFEVLRLFETPEMSCGMICFGAECCEVSFNTLFRTQFVSGFFFQVSIFESDHLGVEGFNYRYEPGSFHLLILGMVIPPLRNPYKWGPLINPYENGVDFPIP